MDARIKSAHDDLEGPFQGCRSPHFGSVRRRRGEKAER
jgi:hypothetical protein